MVVLFLKYYKIINIYVKWLNLQNIKELITIFHSNNNNLAWYSNMNITNRQMFNKCNEYIGSGCDQNIKATFNNDPININSDSPLA